MTYVLLAVGALIVALQVHVYFLEARLYRSLRRICGRCEGSGEVWNYFRRERCPDCNGYGLTPRAEGEGDDRGR